MEALPQRSQNFGGIECVWCPPGTFWMGSPNNRYGASEFETLHQVTLTRGFWIGKYPVTQGQWLRVMGHNPSGFRGVGPEAPVDSVSWGDAQNFCSAVSRAEGIECRLPTEAEWECACRAGSTSEWCFGDEAEALGDYGWYFENSGHTTHPIGQKKPNAWGIYDMHGNVWEWCQDWYETYPAGSVTDPSGPSYGFNRVCRGGSWCVESGLCRSADRSGLDPGRLYFGIGVRVAVSSIP